jgi:hypothetical protein
VIKDLVVGEVTRLTRNGMFSFGTLPVTRSRASAEVAGPDGIG